MVQWWRIHLPIHRTQVRFQVGELRSHMPQGTYSGVPQAVRPRTTREAHIAQWKILCAATNTQHSQTDRWFFRKQSHCWNKTLKLYCLEVSIAESCIWRKFTIRGRQPVKSCSTYQVQKNTDTDHTHQNLCFGRPQRRLLKYSTGQKFTFFSYMSQKNPNPFFGQANTSKAL